MDHTPVPAIYCVGKQITATIHVDGKRYILKNVVICGKKITFTGRRG